MHILITTPTFPPQTGGVAEVVRRQRAYLISRGHTVEVVTGASDTPDPGTEGVQRLAVHAGRFPRYAAGDRWGVRAPSERLRFTEILRRSPAQVILSHCWQAWNTDWAFAEAATLGKPLVLFSHGTSVNARAGVLGPLRWLRWREYAWRNLPQNLRAAAGLFFLEDHADADRFLDVAVARRLGVDARIVPNGCTDALIEAPPANPAVDPLLILCVAQYTPEKNPAAVVEAFAAVDSPDARLVVCGASANRYLDALKAHVRQLPAALAARIELEVGPTRERLVDLYRASALVMSASVTECQPLVLLDAMGAGVPFLSTRVGCVDALPGGEVVDRPADLALALRRLLADPARRRSLGQAGRMAAERKYNWPSSLALLEQGLLEIVARSQTTH